MSAALVLLGLLAAPQGPALAESFNTAATGVFPPAGWGSVDAGSAPAVWAEAAGGLFQSAALMTQVADAAAHDYSLPGVGCDSRLRAPTADLSGLATPELRFASEVHWTLYMAHTPQALADGRSTVEVSADGGATWAPAWQEDALVDDLYPRVVDLGAYAFEPAVELRFRYRGTAAHAWSVDEVVLDGGGGGATPALSWTGGCPGPGSLLLTGATPSGPVAVAWSAAFGPAQVPAGAPCGGAPIGLLQPRLLLRADADAQGLLLAPLNVPAGGCGRVRVQALDLASCVASNTVAL